MGICVASWHRAAAVSHVNGGQTWPLILRRLWLRLTSLILGIRHQRPVIKWVRHEMVIIAGGGCWSGQVRLVRRSTMRIGRYEHHHELAGVSGLGLLAHHNTKWCTGLGYHRSIEAFGGHVHCGTRRPSGLWGVVGNGREPLGGRLPIHILLISLRSIIIHRKLRFLSHIVLKNEKNNCNNIQIIKKFLGFIQILILLYSWK